MIFSVCAVVAILVCVFVWFMIPYSPLKAKFENSYETLLAEVDLKCETFFLSCFRKSRSCYKNSYDIAGLRTSR